MTEQPTTVNRDMLLEALISALEPLPWVHAMWEGGAAAFERVDEWSDVDLMVVADDDRVGDVLPAVEEAIEALSPIALRFELPQPTWHGHAQAFYRLRDASEYLLLDFVAIKASSDDRFLEPERHGAVVVHFDKSGAVRPAPLDRETWRERLRGRLETLRVTYPMFQSLVTKELHRGNDVEAVSFYYGYTLRPLVEVLRLVHTPFQHDYHTRYVHYDLPAGVQQVLRELYYVADPGDLAEKRDRAEALFYETLATIDVDALPLDG